MYRAPETASALSTAHGCAIYKNFQAETGRPKPRGYVACRGALSEAFMDGALATHLPWSGLQAA